MSREQMGKFFLKLAIKGRKCKEKTTRVTILKLKIPRQGKPLRNKS